MGAAAGIIHEREDKALSTTTTTCPTHNHTYHDLIMDIVNNLITDICKTTVTPTGWVVDTLLDIRNLTSEWDSETCSLPNGCDCGD